MSEFKPFPIDTLDDCARHYVEPNERHINCSCFGECDMMNGGCCYCLEFTPYQYYMCRDERLLRSFMHNGDSKNAIIERIEQMHQKHPEVPHSVYVYSMYVKYRSEYGIVKRLSKSIWVRIKNRFYQTFFKKRINKRDKERYNLWNEQTKNGDEPFEF